ncbi:MAG: hypothetical protein AAFV53_39295 [Myxococcota bacterium]
MTVLTRPHSARQATAIAEHGEAAIPVLRHEPGLRGPQATYSVRALGVIGGKKPSMH